MFELPPKIAQATEALVTLALQPRHMPVSGKKLSEMLCIPPRFLEQTMQQLVHAGLLKSVRGPRGGYALADDNDRISLRHISEALCESRFPVMAECSTTIGTDVVIPAYHRAEHELMESLGRITLSTLCGTAREKGLEQALLAMPSPPNESVVSD